MGDVLLTAEVVLGALIALLLLTIVWTAIRRWLITRDQLMILMARRRGDFWVMGMARTKPDVIEWFPILGLGLRPKWTLVREEVEFGPPMPMDRRPGVIQEPVLVDCTCGDQDQQIVVGRPDYTQLRSWSESSPPGFNSGRY